MKNFELRKCLHSYKKFTIYALNNELKTKWQSIYNVSGKLIYNIVYA
jgi:hypothetical protein